MTGSGEWEVARVLGRVQRRVLLARFLGSFGRAAALALFSVGSLVLLGRIVLGAAPSPALCAGTALGLAFLAACVELRKHRIPASAYGAWVDRWSGGSGAIVTLLETGDERVCSAARATLGGLDLRPHLRVTRPLSWSVGGGAYLALVLVLPGSASEVEPPRALFASILDRIEEKEEGLTRALDLPEEERAKLEERLARLREGIESERPESEYEAMDALEADLERAARRAQSAAERALAALAGAQASAASDPALARESIAQALDALERNGFAGALAASGARTMMDGLAASEAQALDTRALEGLAGALSNDVGRRLAELGEAGLLDPSELASAEPSRGFDDFQPTEHVCDEPCKIGGG